MTESIPDLRAAHTGPVDPDEHGVYRLIARDRRRIALSVLSAEDGGVALEDLAAEVCSQEDNDVDQSDVAIELHHVHLPKLDAAEVIEYDPETNSVVATDVPSTLERG